MISIRQRRYLKTFLAMMVFAIIMGTFVPWRSLVETKLIHMLEAQGLSNIRLHVASIGLSGIEVEELVFGDRDSLTLKNVDIGFSLLALWRGSLSHLTLNGLAVGLSQDQGVWRVSGVAAASGEGKSSTLIPVDEESLAQLPLDEIKLKDSNLHVTADQWSLWIPLQLELNKTPNADFSYHGDGLRFKNPIVELTTGTLNVSLQLKPQEKQWVGTWQLKDIKVSGLSGDVPILNAEGSLIIKAESIELDGSLQSEAQDYKSSFRLNYLLNQPQQSSITILAAAMPWNGGIISVQDVGVMLDGKQDIGLKLKVQKVSLDLLLQQLTGKRAGATGAISGILPVTLSVDGNISLQQGSLNAEEAGTIAMSPDAIPGDNEQVAMVRDVLKNFHYATLSVGVSNGANNKTSVLLSLAGNNPDLYAGKPVNLNVRLTGDVLNLVQQNILALTNPKKLLEQGKDAKP